MGHSASSVWLLAKDRLCDIVLCNRIYQFQPLWHWRGHTWRASLLGPPGDHYQGIVTFAISLYNILFAPHTFHLELCHCDTGWCRCGMRNQRPFQRRFHLSHAFSGWIRGHHFMRSFNGQTWMKVRNFVDGNLIAFIIRETISTNFVPETFVISIDKAFSHPGTTFLPLQTTLDTGTYNDV